MALRNDQGIVLRSYPFGEADRVVVLLSPNHGKVRAVAKGVRKTTSRFGGRLEPFTHVELVLYGGRGLDTITQVAVIEAFPHLRGELERVLAAGTMVEVVDAVTQEEEGSARAFLLLYRGLHALESGPRHPDLVTAFGHHDRAPRGATTAAGSNCCVVGADRGRGPPSHADLACTSDR